MGKSMLTAMTSMVLRRTNVLAVLTAVLIIFCSFNVTAQTPAPNPIIPSVSTSRDPLFNSRLDTLDFQKKYYKACSIYVFIKSLFKVEILELSTFKISSCPASEIRNVTAASVIAQLKSITPITLLTISGPYFNLMDENNSVVLAQSLPIGNLGFSQVMTAQIGAADLLWNFKSVVKWSNAEVYYNPLLTQRNVDFTWYKDSTIYKLVSDKGLEYVMVYFTPLDADKINGEEELTKKLNRTPSLLTLPPGWSFKIEKLDSVLNLREIAYRGAGTEMVIDELDNIYMRVEKLRY